MMPSAAGVTRRGVLEIAGALGLLAIARPLSAAVASPRVGRLRIRVLSTMLADGDMLGEWGYSALVEVDGHRFLFDTGAHPDVVLKNSETMGIDLSSIEDVILSHNHDDHTGGLVTLRDTLMTRNPAALSRAHVGAGIFAPRAGRNGTEGNGLLPSKARYEASGGRFVVHDRWDALLPGVWFTGPVPRRYPEQNWNPGLALRTSAGTAPDTIAEDSSLVFATADGLVLLTGCGHAGIANIVDDAADRSGDARLLAVVGGLHLFAKDDGVIRWTADKLKARGLRYLLAGHCTGIEATYRLRDLLGLDRRTAVVSAVGSAFELGQGIAAGEIAA
jgi:7,8-dihydropterin-6-yl-methyl-4-(beta-D-ribofuranosyl)aminobenzene 5'-phosphate synthase